MSGSRALVTGGAGFIGSHLVDDLLKDGWAVTVLDDLSNSNAASVPDGALFVQADIRDREAVRRAAGGAEVVFHLAAVGSVPRSMKDPALAHDVNVGGTFNVLAAGMEAGARALVFSSSSSVYGDDVRLPKSEENTGRPLSPYAASKRAGEIEAQGLAAIYPGTIAGLRYFNVYGPRQRHDSPYAAVIPLFFRAALSGERPTIFGDGLQSRDFTHVSDVVRANRLAAAAVLPAGRCHVYNVGAGASTSVNELWSAIARLTGAGALPEVSPLYAPPRAGDVRDSLASIERARGELGFQPAHTVTSGLAATLPWYRDSLSAGA